jgi:hypothetical protein
MRRAAVANAVGIAIAQVSCDVDRVHIKRERAAAIAETTDLGTARSRRWHGSARSR